MNEPCTKSWRHSALSAVLFAYALPAPAASPQPVLTPVPQTGGQSAPLAAIDYAHAAPMPLPSFRPSSTLDGLQEAISAQASYRTTAGPSGSLVEGARGNGKRSPAVLPVAKARTDGISSQEYGTTAHPFSTVRNNSPRNTNTSYPSRASGRLFFSDGTSTYVCSGSLIKRGIVVTAAHCVTSYGSGTYYSNWQFVPGYRNGEAPFGVWTAASAAVPSTYLNGSDACYSGAPGVVCENDVALLTLSPQNGDYPGSATGWYGYGWDGYGFTGAKLAQITQIGYPACLDSGLYQQRNDSFGFTSSQYQNNTLIGSLMCGGSSGGPWLVNFGTRPTLSGTSAGSADAATVVIGVTSWGYTESGPKEMGASRFTGANIKALVEAACAATPSACS